MSQTIRAATHVGPPPWPTLDPFLFCVHHVDGYPAGNDAMGPAASLAGRRIGMDFAGKDGWNMYHGDVIPGFPRHPHRGFETITLVRTGRIDHSDSLGATARFGDGDVQWMTAGKGIVHAEMFPLRHRERGNPLELFQIWLNLPAADKMVDPYFTMMWADTIPRLEAIDAAGLRTEVVVVAGELDGAKGPPPPPDSWANKPQSDVSILTISMEPGATWTLPAGPATANRALYTFAGPQVTVGGQRCDGQMLLHLAGDQPVLIEAGAGGSELLLLQGRPLREPIAKHGPFVMNTRTEIEQHHMDYRATGFGGWPWGSDGPVHAREADRFAIHADGRKETPST